MNTTGPKTILRLRREAVIDNFIGLYFALKYDNGNIAVAEPLRLTTVEPNQALPHHDPLFSFDDNQAQRLMDELWNLGIRPTEGHGSTGQLAATEKHLDHVSTLLTDAFKTVQNVVNASLVTQHHLPVPKS
jgi:hypothetical protein